MKTSRYTEAQIIAILRQAEGGVPVAELCREHGMSSASGLVAHSCRSKCSFRPPGVRRPRGFFLPMLNADGVGYRSR